MSLWLSQTRGFPFRLYRWIMGVRVKYRSIYVHGKGQNQCFTLGTSACHRSILWLCRVTDFLSTSILVFFYFIFFFFFFFYFFFFFFFFIFLFFFFLLNPLSVFYVLFGFFERVFLQQLCICIR